MGVESNPILLVLSGPSGVGKTTVAKRLLSEGDDLVRVVTCTTREPRDGETTGVDYHFLSEKEFIRRVKAVEFLEHAEVYGKRYGTTKSSVREMLASGRNVLLVNDVQGALSICAIADQDEQLKNAKMAIILMTVDIIELSNRLKLRGEDGSETIKKRLAVAELEMEQGNRFDYVVASRTKEEDWQRVQAIYHSLKNG
jgi:guanylate kinase